MNSLLKSLLTFLFLCTIATMASSQSRQTQAILDAWDHEVVAEIFADTITCDTSYSDTVEISRWAGSPQRFTLFLEIDSVQRKTNEVALTAVFQPSIEKSGPFYEPAGTLGEFPPMSSAFNSTGRFVFEVHPYGGNYARFSFTCTDTLFLRATLWMKH